MMLLTTETMHKQTNEQTNETNQKKREEEKPFLHYRGKEVRKRFTSARYPQALAAASVVGNAECATLRVLTRTERAREGFVIECCFLKKRGGSP